jgi:protein arginine kinase
MHGFFSNQEDSGIVLTSRVRLARNVENLPFPHMLSPEDSKKISNMVSDAVLGSKLAEDNDLHLIELKDLSPTDRVALVEKHLVSMDLVNSYEKSSVILSRDEDVAIMINEEDHVRLQVIYPGFKIKEAYEFATRSNYSKQHTIILCILCNA